MNPKFRVMHVVKRKHIQKDKIQLTVKKIRGKWIELGKQENPEIVHRSQFFSIFFCTFLCHCPISTSAVIFRLYNCQKNWVGIIAIKIQSTRIHLKLPNRRCILDSLVEPLTGDWRKITSGHRTRSFRSHCLKFVPVVMTGQTIKKNWQRSVKNIPSKVAGFPMHLGSKALHELSIHWIHSSPWSI